MTVDQLLEERRYEPEAWGALCLAVAHAAASNWPRVQPAHIVLAVLQRDPGLVDEALRKHLRGLRAATLESALREQLSIDAELENLAAGNFPPDGRPRPEDLAETAIDALRSLPDMAVAFDRLAQAALLQPDEVTGRVLWQYCRVKKDEFIAVGRALPVRSPAGASGPADRLFGAVEIVVDGNVNLQAFEPVLQQAIGSLGVVAAARSILEVDLLRALLETDASQLRRRLLLDRQLTTALDILRAEDGGAAWSVKAGPIPEGRLGRLVRRVLNDAARLAANEGSAVIAEGHYLRAHHDRVGQAEGNVFARAGIDLRAFLETLAVSPPVTAAPAAGSSAAVASGEVWEDGALRWSAFGPVASAAWKSLLPVAAQRALLDVDLLSAFLRQPQSALLEALHVITPSVPDVKFAWEQLAGPLTPPAGEPLKQLREEHLGRMLKLVVRDAAQLARDEGYSAVSESHLVRAHLSRTSAGTGNLYDRLSIPVARLREYVARFPQDRDPQPAAKSSGAIANVPEYLNARVINQPHAVERAAKALIRMRSGLGEPGQVLGKFLFLGATGVGKTELARAMADVAFGPDGGVRDAHLIRIDCGNFQNKWDIVQLIGAAQGLVGYGEGQLTNGLREKPRSVILFDEAEKAEKSIWQSLLPLFDEGLVRDPAGAVFDATQCILIATSNKGYSEAVDATNAWNRDWPSVKEDVESRVWNSLDSYFSPEFLGRFGRPNVIFFNHFGKEDYRAIVDLQLQRIRDEMLGRGIQLECDPPVAEWLTLEAWRDRREGARPVRRLITEHIRDRLVAARVEDPSRSRFHFTLAGQTVDLREAT